MKVRIEYRQTFYKIVEISDDFLPLLDENHPWYNKDTYEPTELVKEFNEVIDDEIHHIDGDVTCVTDESGQTIFMDW